MTVPEALWGGAAEPAAEAADPGAAGRAGIAAGRAVEVAVDAAGGDRTYTYLVPDRLADLGLGEVVLVDFGRRQALGIVLSEAAVLPGGPIKLIVDRVRADGPLVPVLGLRLARWIADRYLAPPALVLRSMLPPGLLERLELVAELAPAADDTSDPPAVDRGDATVVDLLTQLEAGPRAVRDLAGPDGRAGLLRRLRALEADGRVCLEWMLLGAGAGPRYERWIRLTDDGHAALAVMASGGRPAGRPLGPRQVEALTELGAATDELPAAQLTAHDRTAAVAGLVRRGLVAAEVRERPRRPLAARPAGRRGGRPPMSDLLPAQAEAVARISAAVADRDPRPLLLDGVTGGGKTAIYI